MQSNLVLQANFVTNPFLAGAGSSYYGLFTPANAVRQNTNSGAFTFTYGSPGTVSGTIWLGPDTVSLSSNFDVSGRVRMVSPRHGESNLITTLQLDFADGTVGGQVTDGSFVAAVGRLSGRVDVAESGDQLPGQLHRNHPRDQRIERWTVGDGVWNGDGGWDGEHHLFR